jgi:glucose-6-phosphate isomerase
VTSPGPDLLQTLVDRRVASRLWHRDTTLFVPEQAPRAAHDAILNRLGWLDAPVEMARTTADLTAFAATTLAAGLSEVYLLGTGGSSLSAEVYRDVPGPHAASCRLTVVDTTDEQAIRQTTEALTPARALFIVASKSGTTVEVRALEQHFWAVMTRALGDTAGRHFVAITDDGMPLAVLARERKYERTFLAPADIGGRFSALSPFGLVPAALLGWDLAAVLESGREMAARCQPDRDVNPGLALGAFMAACAQHGSRDKLTPLFTPALAALGPWIEQLVAESTGKGGRGVLPIIGEPAGAPDGYGTDRQFVVADDPDAPDLLAAGEALQAAGHPVFRIDARAESLGAEFFRWEFATAVAGVALGVNPFDEPNVRDAKARTTAHLEAHRSIGTFHVDPPFQKGEGYLRREHHPIVAAYARRRTGRYVAILDYLPGDRDRTRAIARLRALLRQRTRVATTYGVGPRYLHSTGQYHKGGPNTGLFLLFTAADAGGTPIPGSDYTFSTLKQAQAFGDFEALAASGRDVVHYHIDDPAIDVSAQFEKIVKAFSESEPEAG